MKGAKGVDIVFITLLCVVLAKGLSMVWRDELVNPNWFVYMTTATLAYALALGSLRKYIKKPEDENK